MRGFKKKMTGMLLLFAAVFMMSGMEASALSVPVSGKTFGMYIDQEMPCEVSIEWVDAMKTAAEYQSKGYEVTLERVRSADSSVAAIRKLSDTMVQFYPVTVRKAGTAAFSVRLKLKKGDRVKYKKLKLTGYFVPVTNKTVNPFKKITLNGKSIISNFKKAKFNSSKKKTVRIRGRKARLVYKLKKGWKMVSLKAEKVKGTRKVSSTLKNQGTVVLPKGGYIMIHIKVKNRKTRMYRTETLYIYNAQYKGKL